MKSILAKLLLLIILGALFVGTYLFFFNSKDSNIKESNLDFSLSKEETDNYIFIKYKVENVGDRDLKLEFPTNIKLQYSVSYIGEEDFNENDFIKRPDTSEQKIIELKSQESVEYSIRFSTKNAPKGEYIVYAKLATINVNSPELIEQFVIE